jgi:hypothetical protein
MIGPDEESDEEYFPSIDGEDEGKSYLDTEDE